jgi:hypothetical protein
MNFFGLRDTAIESLLIRRERCVVAAGLSLQAREVVPGVRQVGPAGEHAQIRGLSLGEAPGLLQRDRAAQQGLGIC